MRGIQDGEGGEFTNLWRKFLQFVLSQDEGGQVLQTTDMVIYCHTMQYALHYGHTFELLLTV